MLPLSCGEPQRCGLGSGQLLHQALQRQPIGSTASSPIGLGGGKLLKEGVLTCGRGIQAGVAERAGALLVLTAGDTHQPHAITQVVLQGTGDAAAQIGPSRLASSAAGGGKDQSLAGYLDQILPLHQREQAPGSSGGNDIGQRQVLQHQGITGLEGRAAEGGSGGSHRQDGEEPHPHRPAAAPRQGRPEAMPPGAHGLILDAA